jgi:hypothetical protein
MSIFKSIPAVNLQALLALGCFGLCLFFARVVRRISEGAIPGGAGSILYLRTLIGFLFAASIALGLASFAGIDVLKGGIFLHG